MQGDNSWVTTDGPAANGTSSVPSKTLNSKQRIYIFSQIFTISEVEFSVFHSERQFAKVLIFLSGCQLNYCD